jgi:hypothetical protein
MDALGETQLVDAGLETTLQEIFNLEGQDVIEPHAGFVQHADTDEAADEGVSFEQTLGVLLVEGEELTVKGGGKILVSMCARNSSSLFQRGGEWCGGGELGGGYLCRYVYIHICMALMHTHTYTDTDTYI